MYDLQTPELNVRYENNIGMPEIMALESAKTGFNESGMNEIETIFSYYGTIDSMNVTFDDESEHGRRGGED